MRMQRRDLLLAAIVLGLGGCAGSGHAADTPAGPDTPAAPDGPDPEVLAPWREFPVDRRPRPLVLVDEVPKVAGFSSDAGKVAALAGEYEVAAPLPAAPAARMSVNLPDGPAELAVLPAAEAVTQLRNPTVTVGAEPRPKPLRITRVEFGTAAFRTDRGEVRLPSWLFHAPDALEPIAVPALAPEAFWRPSQPEAARPAMTFDPVTVAADGRQLTVTLPAPPDPCPGERPEVYEAVAVESATAVAVGVRVVTPASGAGDCARPLILRTAQYPVTLTAPLGNRVLLDGEGGVFAVTTGA
jgi:hypothetical protein